MHWQDAVSRTLGPTRRNTVVASWAVPWLKCGQWQSHKWCKDGICASLRNQCKPRCISLSCGLPSSSQIVRICHLVCRARSVWRPRDVGSPCPAPAPSLFPPVLYLCVFACVSRSLQPTSFASPTSRLATSSRQLHFHLRLASLASLASPSPHAIQHPFARSRSFVSPPQELPSNSLARSLRPGDSQQSVKYLVI